MGHNRAGVKARLKRRRRRNEVKRFIAGLQAANPAQAAGAAVDVDREIRQFMMSKKCIDKRC